MKHVFVDFDDTLYLHNPNPQEDVTDLDTYYKESGGLLNTQLLDIIRNESDCKFYMLSAVKSVTERVAKCNYLTHVAGDLFDGGYGSDFDKAAWISKWCEAKNVSITDCILIDDNTQSYREECRRYGITLYNPLYIVLKGCIPKE